MRNVETQDLENEDIELPCNTGRSDYFTEVSVLRGFCVWDRMNTFDFHCTLIFSTMLSAKKGFIKEKRRPGTCPPVNSMPKTAAK